MYTIKIKMNMFLNLTKSQKKKLRFFFINSIRISKFKHQKTKLYAKNP
jgi:hypothetical protein